MQEKLFAAIDLGGTKIYTVLANENGEILTHVRRETHAQGGPEVIIRQITDSVHQALTQAGREPARLKAAGVCAAGFFDWKKKMLVHSPNMPGWNNVPLETKLSKALHVPVLAENDANAAALGEARLGAGRGSRDVIFLTVSTGIGAGLILGGRIYRGTGGFAGEAGHMVVKPDGPLCGCGRHGCLETVASGTAIAREANEAIANGRASLLSKLAKETKSRVSAPDVFAAAGQNDGVAREILGQVYYYLGIGLVNLINLLNPEVIVIGGGVAQAGEVFFEPLRAIIKKNAIPPAAAAVSLRPAQLGVEAGVAGMLALLRENHTGE